MIADALEFLRRGLQNTLHVDEDMVFVDSVRALHARRGICVTLVNVLEDAAFRREAPTPRDPVAALNELTDATTLHVLCAFASHSYADDLRLLAESMSWVRRMPIYSTMPANGANGQTAPTRIDSLIIEPMNLRGDELAQVWAMLGHAYVPSMVLRLRVLHRTTHPTPAALTTTAFDTSVRPRGVV